MNNNAQNGSFCNVTTKLAWSQARGSAATHGRVHVPTTINIRILLTDPGQDAFYHASNRTMHSPQMVGFAQIVWVNSPSSR